jgi:2-succinyl-6-hydroxy-2,4-cyclohexadiene-1-carboxylate synthase
MTLLLHGFTRDGRMWAPLLEGQAPDLPGHGGAAAPARSTKFFDVVDALVPSTPMGVVGYSMGARLALWLAVRHPARVRWLALDGASLGLETEPERTARREADATWSRMLRTKGIEAFAKAWTAQPIFGGRGAYEGLLAQDPQGLAAALDCLGKGNMPYLGRLASALRCPVLLVNGDRDTKGIAEADRVSVELPHARRVTLPGHHAVHAEAPDAWRACVTTFISEQHRTLEAA